MNVFTKFSDFFGMRSTVMFNVHCLDRFPFVLDFFESAFNLIPKFIRFFIWIYANFGPIVGHIKKVHLAILNRKKSIDHWISELHIFAIKIQIG